MVRGEPRRHGHLSFESAYGQEQQALANCKDPQQTSLKLLELQGNILTYGTESRSFPSKRYKHLSYGLVKNCLHKASNGASCTGY